MSPHGLMTGVQIFSKVPAAKEVGPKIDEQECSCSQVLVDVANSAWPV
jgi:hypothetical protein